MPLSVRSNLLACLVCAFAFQGYGHAAEPTLSFVEAKNSPWLSRVRTQTVYASNFPRGATLTLHLLDPETKKSGPPILADLSQENDQLQLTPRFALVAGTTYRAVLSHEGKTIASRDWKIAEPEATAPNITEILPANSVLPANLLKFHIAFSEPMRQSRDIFDHIHLIDTDTDKKIEAPWRRQELWSDDHRRLTLWIHPGRVKQGVNLRTTMGPVLQPDKNYALLIDAGLLSLPGKPTTAPTEKKFTTVAEDHSRPTAKTWQLTLPRVGTSDPVIIESPEPLDTPLALRYLSLTDILDQAVGHTLVTRNLESNLANRFAFIPTKPWRNEPYTIHAGTFLEDLAGNTPTRVFDTDLENPAAEPTEADLQRTFRPLPASP